MTTTTLLFIRHHMSLVVVARSLYIVENPLERNETLFFFNSIRSIISKPICQFRFCFPSPFNSLCEMF
jgi:hypothetical protein